MANGRTSDESKATTVSRCEIFDEADLDAALARFEELSRPAPRLENAASHAYERFRSRFEIRDWAAIAEILAGTSNTADDRRRVMSAGNSARSRCGNREPTGDRRSRHHKSDIGLSSRPAESASSSATTRGRDQGAEAFHTDVLSHFETNADERIAAPLCSRSTSSTQPLRSSTLVTSQVKPP